MGTAERQGDAQLGTDAEGLLNLVLCNFALGEQADQQHAGLQTQFLGQPFIAMIGKNVGNFVANDRGQLRLILRDLQKA